MPVAHLHALAHLDHAVLHAAHAHAADKVVIVHAGDQHLHGGFGVALGRGDVFQDGIEQRVEVFAHLARLKGGGSLLAGAVEDLAFQLLLVGVQVKQQVVNLLGDLLVAGVGAVGLVDHDDDLVSQRQRLGQHKAGLRHRPLKGVNQQDDAVHHLQDALYLAAEVGVSGGVDDVDLGALIVDGCIFCQDGDASLALEVPVIHDALLHVLVVAEGAALLKHLVNQGGLAVVDVRDDGDISQIVSDHVKLSFFKMPDMTCGQIRRVFPISSALCRRLPGGKILFSL